MGTASPSLADAGSRSYPSLPEQSGEAPSTMQQRPVGPVQKVGDEHMFHQKVIFGRISPSPPSYTHSHTRYDCAGCVECVSSFTSSTRLTSFFVLFDSFFVL